MFHVIILMAILIIRLIDSLHSPNRLKFYREREELLNSSKEEGYSSYDNSLKHSTVSLDQVEIRAMFRSKSNKDNYRDSWSTKFGSKRFKSYDHVTLLSNSYYSSTIDLETFTSTSLECQQTKRPSPRRPRIFNPIIISKYYNPKGEDSRYPIRKLFASHPKRTIVTSGGGVKGSPLHRLSKRFKRKRRKTLVDQDYINQMLLIAKNYTENPLLLLPSTQSLSSNAAKDRLNRPASLLPMAEKSKRQGENNKTNNNNNAATSPQPWPSLLLLMLLTPLTILILTFT